MVMETNVNEGIFAHFFLYFSKKTNKQTTYVEKNITKAT